MTFRSILFDGLGEQQGPAVIDASPPPRPAWFDDLRLTEIVANATAGREELDLAPLFHLPLTSRAAVLYRHEVFRDLESPPILAAIRRFGGTMAAMRGALVHVRRSGYRVEEQRWILAAREHYCAAVNGLAKDLAVIVAPENVPAGVLAGAPRSAGLRALAAYLAEQVESGSFARLVADTRTQAAALAAVNYRLEIGGTRIRVSRWPGGTGTPAGGATPGNAAHAPTRAGSPSAGRLDREPNFGAEIRTTFERFRQGSLRQFAFETDESDAMNRLEAEIAGRVTRLFPDVFAALEAYCAAHADFLDPTIVRFDREVQLYVAWLEHIERFRRVGLAFCYPDVQPGAPETHASDVVDLALAARRAADGEAVVPNSVSLCRPERILVISGPNQGGKTTFARTLGQLHHLAALGLPVPGSQVRLALVDRIFTHFEREEDLLTLTSKLEDELLRIRAILDAATPDSLVVLNESFGSTSLADALAIGRDVLGRIEASDALCVFVTFLDELAALGPAVVSMVSTVDPVDPALRTFRIVRQAADGLAHAGALARKHRLTEAHLRERLAR